MAILDIVRAVLASDVFAAVTGVALFVGVLYVLYCAVSGRGFDD